MEGAALLVLATYRSTPPDRSGALSAVVADLVRRDDVHRVDLGGLDLSDIIDYLVATGAGRPTDVRGPASLLRDHTGGNPFALNEVWRELEARGGVEALRSGGLTVPESLRSLLSARLSRLPDEQQRLVCLGAVVGEVFEVDVVAAAATDVQLEEAFAAMEAARAAGLIEPVVDGPGQFRFAHALAQQAVQTELTSYELARAHAAVAATLRARSADRPGQLLRLAHHYALAAGLGLAEEAARYLGLAAEAAERQLALSDAAELFERAAAHTGQGVERDGLVLEAARCHLLTGHRLRALELDDQVAGSDDPGLRLLAAIGFEAASWRAGVGAHHSVALLRRALATSDRADDDPLVVRATGALASALSMSGEADEGRRQSRRALARARERGDRDLLAAVLDSSLFVGVDADSLRDRAEHARELTPIARAGNHWTALGRAAMVRCHTSYVLGDPYSLHQGLEDLATAARETRQPYMRWTVLLFTASLHLMACDFDAARAAMAQGRRIEAEFEPGYSAGEGPQSLQEFMLRRETGRLDFAREALEAGLHSEVPWRPGVVALCMEIGLRDRARAALREALQLDLPALRASATWPASLSFLGEAAAELGDEEAMRILLPEAERHAGLNLMGSEMLALLGSADLLTAQLRAGLGRSGVEASFASALEMDHRMGSALHEATTHAHWARHLRRVGAPADQVRQHEEPARAAARRHGLARVLRILGPDNSEALPDGLTAREVEVLGLLAEGASNRDIATQLVISEHTAANHVRSILMKTQSANRTAAAHYAVRHRLVREDGSEHGQA
jgi:DNA-binding CsgD family transcriptional regulator